MKVSAVVLTFNSERMLEKCLKSIRWADEIIVVDSFSKDRTLEIAASFKAVIFQNAYESYSKQIEFAVGKSKNDWVLILDSDEEITTELEREIINLNEDNIPSGYMIPRLLIFAGKEIKHGGWYPDYQYRLFNKQKSVINHLEVHGSYFSNNRKLLKNKILHYSYKNIYDYVERLNNYTSLDVSTMINKHKNARWFNFILNPISKFLRMFIFRAGFKDGYPGFLLAVLSSYYTMLNYMKLWEYAKHKKAPITNNALRAYQP